MMDLIHETSLRLNIAQWQNSGFRDFFFSFGGEDRYYFIAAAHACNTSKSVPFFLRRTDEDDGNNEKFNQPKKLSLKVWNNFIIGYEYSSKSEII